MKSFSNIFVIPRAALKFLVVFTFVCGLGTGSVHGFSLDDIILGMGNGSTMGQLLVRDDPGLAPAPGSPPGGTNFSC